ncbi:hypothetical protein SAMN05444920_11670 [Nonomuraea solani]|uniref:Uncharacterized protein n=1 Tax=Nonomuraea solani TaxID=1144553 RepID=A0A1H6ETI4_9ACTN|nr:hypothetical protein [Nonomuraea solani]SEH00336.1 hypothetical protein SAMN05444920_11670 [Nonomuraea solani]
MPRLKRLTIEEARTLTRAELLPRIEEEQRYWYQRIHRCMMQPGDEQDFKTFNDILHITTAPYRSDVLQGDYWAKPLGELGEL